MTSRPPLRLPLAAAVVAVAGCGGAMAGPSWDPMSEIWCAGREEITRALALREGAARLGQGLRDPESVLEVWSDAGGGWTVVISYADGRSCVVARGEAWAEDETPPS